LYTKKVLENIWNRYKKEKSEQKAKAAATHSVEDKKLAKKEFNQQKEEAPQNISLDMLKGLQDKFKK
jgi:DNA polymerase-3 subunit epsilon